MWCCALSNLHLFFVLTLVPIYRDSKEHVWYIHYYLLPTILATYKSKSSGATVLEISVVGIEVVVGLGVPIIVVASVAFDIAVSLENNF